MRRLSWIMQKALNAATCTEERKGDLTHIEKKIHMRMIQRETICPQTDRTEGVGA